MTRELFVYYRVALADLAAASEAVRAMQAGLAAAHAGLQGRLLRRPEVVDGRCTLMETYARPGLVGVDLAVQAEIDRAAGVLAPWLIGARHTEVFVPCA